MKPRKYYFLDETYNPISPRTRFSGYYFVPIFKRSNFYLNDKLIKPKSKSAILYSLHSFFTRRESNMFDSLACVYEHHVILCFTSVRHPTQILFNSNSSKKQLVASLMKRYLIYYSQPVLLFVILQCIRYLRLLTQRSRSNSLYLVTRTFNFVSWSFYFSVC